MRSRRHEFGRRGCAAFPAYHSAVIPPSTRRPRLPGVLRGGQILLGVVLLAALAGCGGRTFDPAAPCTEDGRAPGAYPALEAVLPTSFDGRPPDSLDSGRNCEPAGLGTLAERGVEELRFAGAIWDLGSGGGVTEAVLEAPGLRADWVAEFYEAGARSGRRVEAVTVSEAAVGELVGTRIDALNGESFQTVVVVPDATDRVRVAIVASPIRVVQTRERHDEIVLNALIAGFPGVCCN
jgi:hypothetical protein